MTKNDRTERIIDHICQTQDLMEHNKKYLAFFIYEKTRKFFHFFQIDTGKNVEGPEKF
jgi:hypothetical protein